MSSITFRRVAPDEARIYQDSDHVGDLYRQDDILAPGAVYYVVHLDEDPRGPVRIHERARIRQITEQRMRTHPLWS